MSRRLAGLQIKRISIVDDPAVESARIVLYKAADGTAKSDPGPDARPGPAELPAGAEQGTKAEVWAQALKLCGTRVGPPNEPCKVEHAKPGCTNMDHFLSTDAVGRELYRRYAQAPGAHEFGVTGGQYPTLPAIEPPKPAYTALKARALAAETERNERGQRVLKIFKADGLADRFPGRDPLGACVAWTEFLTKKGLADRASDVWCSIRQPAQVLGTTDPIEAFAEALGGGLLAKAAARIAEADLIPVETAAALAESAFGTIRGALHDSEATVAVIEKRAQALGQRIDVALDEAGNKTVRLSKRLDGVPVPTFGEALGEVVGLSWDADAEIAKAAPSAGKPSLNDEVNRRTSEVMKRDGLAYPAALSKVFNDDSAFYARYLTDVAGV